jgi:hypothetical protein
MLSAAESVAEVVNSKLTNALSEAADELERLLTDGLGFDELSNSLSRISTNQDEYLTKTN